MIEFKLPELGEGVTTGAVVKVLIKPGDIVKPEQAVIEIETDKAVLEVPSSVAGCVIEVRVREGEKAKVGEVLFTIDGAGATGKTPAAATPQAERTTTPAPRTAPEKIVTAPTAAPPKPSKTGTPEARTVALATPPSHPAPATLSHPVPATPPSHPVPATPSQLTPAAPARQSPPQPETASTATTDIPAAPAARREAREIGVDLTRVRGSGLGGRITVEDVRSTAREQNQGVIARDANSAAIFPGHPGDHHALRASGDMPALPDFSKWGEIARQEMSTVRRLTAERMTLAWNTIPHVTQFDKVDVTVLDELRARFAKRAEDAGGKLTLTVILLKLVASALRVLPQFNASVDMGKSEIVTKKYIHIGVAVDTDRGLIVPVIRDADKKNIIELAIELHRAADRARQHKTTREEMQGASFTITNLGGIGGAYFTPIIIPPEVAILGVSRSAKEPCEQDGKIVFRNMMPLSLSYDHRVIDGADAVRFLRWIANAAQDPSLMGLAG